MLISFGQPSLFLLFPFFMPIFYFFRTYLEMIVPFFTNPDHPNVKINYPFFTSFLIMLSNFVMGVPVSIVYCINKRNKNKKQENYIDDHRISKSYFTQIREKKKSKYKIVLLVIVITLFVCTILIASIILNSTPERILIGFKMNIFLIFFDSFFSYIILKYPIHKHQIIAIVICIIGIIIVCIEVITNFEPILFSCFLGVYFLVSLVDIMEKWLMEKEYVNPSNLLFYIGTCGMVIYAFLFTAVGLLTCPKQLDFLCKYNRFTNNSIENILEIMTEVFKRPFILLMMIVTVCVGTGYLIFFLLTLFYFSPTHRCLSDILNSFIFWIYTNITGTYDKMFGATLTGYLLIFFGSLVYNEIIILHFWGLDYNTKKDIYRRSLNDTQISNQTSDNFDYDNVDGFDYISLSELNDNNNKY